MAIGVQSSNIENNGASASTSMIIAKPTGLAAGDLMIAQICLLDETGTITPPSGFTLIRNTVNGSVRSALYYKIADAGDVAATNFTWTFTSCLAFGGLVRVTGHDPQNPVNGSSGATPVGATQTPTFDNTISPRNASSLFLMFVAHKNNNSGMSNYAVVTDNPSWTEIWDSGNTGGAHLMVASAKAVRAAITPTGNSSVTGDGATDADWVGQLVVVNIPYAEISDTASLTEAVTIAATYNMVASEILSLVEVAATAIKTVWEYAAKAAKSWTNDDK